MTIYIIGEYREQFKSKIKGRNFNPHPTYGTILEIQEACKKHNLPCNYFGGVQELVHAIDTHKKFDSDILFMNISDGLTQSYCRIQAPVLLEMLGVKYTGSSPFVVGLVNNKHYTKLAIKKAVLPDLNLPEDILIDRSNELRKQKVKNLNYPIIIKPNNDGFSIGIDEKSIVFNFEDLAEKTRNLQKEYEEILIEEYIPGIDVSVFLIGNLPNIEINEIIVYKTYNSFIQEKTARDMYVKANKLSERYSANLLLPEEISQKLKNISVEIFKLLNIRDIARIDYRINDKGKIYFLEANVNPGMASNTEPKIVCENLNCTYADFIYKYISTALKRYE